MMLKPSRNNQQRRRLFSLTLEAGNDVYLNISYVGYDSFHRSFIQLEQDTLLPVLLNSHQQLAEVVVTGEYTSSPLVQTSDMGHTRLNKDLIQQTPVLFGEADIIKPYRPCRVYRQAQPDWQECMCGAVMETTIFI